MKCPVCFQGHLNDVPDEEGLVYGQCPSCGSEITTLEHSIRNMIQIEKYLQNVVDHYQQPEEHVA